MLSELPQLIERLAWLTLLLSAIVLVAYMASTRSREALLALLFLALIFAHAILIGPVSEPRFRLNVAPFIFILGFTGIHLALTYLKKKILSRQGAPEKRGACMRSIRRPPAEGRR